jgi:hypothetical protein
MATTRHWYLALMALAIPFLSNGQSDSHQQHRVFKKGGNLVTYQFGYGQAMLHEIKVDHFISDNFSLLYSMRYSRPSIQRNASDAEFTAPLGASLGLGMGLVMGSGSACGYMDPDTFIGLFMYSCMIPDGVAFHCFLNEKMDFSPYINLSGLTIASRENITKFYYTPSAGLRLLYSVTPHLLLTAEQQVLVRPEQVVSANVALGLGISF